VPAILSHFVSSGLGKELLDLGRRQTGGADAKVLIDPLSRLASDFGEQGEARMFEGTSMTM
jgi:hypothetical protein